MSSSAGVDSPSQVAIIGDRLMTDVVMANMMGSLGIWVALGVKPMATPVSTSCQVTKSIFTANISSRFCSRSGFTKDL